MIDLAAIEAAAERGDGTALDAALVRHHGVHAPRVMCALHQIAARFWADDPAQAAFHDTHAYVYALEAGMWNDAERLYRRLEADRRM